MTQDKTGLQARIESNQPILVVEMSPPKGGDPEPVRAAAKRFAGKVHAIGLSDNYGHAESEHSPRVSQQRESILHRILFLCP